MQRQGRSVAFAVRDVPLRRPGMLPNFTYPADIFPSARFYHKDLADEPLELIRTSEGQPAVAPFGRLPEPHPQRLAKVTVRRATVEAASR